MNILDHQKQLALGLRRASVMQRDVFVLETLVALFTRIEVDSLLKPFALALSQDAAESKDIDALTNLVDAEDAEVGSEGFAVLHALQWFIQRASSSPRGVAEWCVNTLDEFDQDGDAEMNEDDLGPWAAAEVNAQGERLAKVLAMTEPSDLLTRARVELARLANA